MKKLLLLTAAIFIQIQLLWAQNANRAQKVAMADALREEGKIYVVVIVVCIIFTGLLLYILSMERKIGKLEREVHHRINKI